MLHQTLINSRPDSNHDETTQRNIKQRHEVTAPLWRLHFRVRVYAHQHINTPRCDTAAPAPHPTQTEHLAWSLPDIPDPAGNDVSLAWSQIRLRSEGDALAPDNGQVSNAADVGWNMFGAEQVEERNEGWAMAQIHQGLTMSSICCRRKVPDFNSLINETSISVSQCVCLMFATVSNKHTKKCWVKIEKSNSRCFQGWISTFQEEKSLQPPLCRWKTWFRHVKDQWKQQVEVLFWRLCLKHSTACVHTLALKVQCPLAKYEKRTIKRFLDPNNEKCFEFHF